MGKRKKLRLRCKTTQGISISWELKDGTLHISSNLSEEETKTVMALCVPPWAVKASVGLDISDP